MHPILITGATGKTGNAVARQLLAAGHTVRAVVHRRDVRAYDLARYARRMEFVAPHRARTAMENRRWIAERNAPGRSAAKPEHVLTIGEDAA